MTSWLPTWLGGTPATNTSVARPTVGGSMPTTEEMVESLGETVEDLRHKRILALQRSKKLEKEAKQLHALGKKAEAMSLMKRRATYQTQVRQLEAQIGNMEQTLMAVESTATGIDVANGMKNGAGAMKQLLEQTSVDEVHEAADDLQEAMSDATEIMDAVSRPLQLGNAVEEEDLEAEMASWNDGNGNQALTTAPSLPQSSTPDDMPALPNVPTKTRTQPEKNESIALH